MRFLFKFFIFIFYFVLVACTSGKKSDDEAYLEGGEENIEEYSDEYSLSGEIEEEDDEEELEFMAQRQGEVLDPNAEESFIPEEEEEEDPTSSEEDNFNDGEIINSEIEPGIYEDESLENITYNQDSSPEEVSEPTPPQKSWVPLKKIPQTTWMHDGKWINSVYIARPGEDLMTISQKIYTEDKQEELKSVNPFLKRRDPKVGDKIYYTSPMRPQDREQFLFYYEDKNQTPQSHDIEAGENIREIASQLLGHEDSWKEIWATNLQVDSKWVLNKKTTILYWPENQQTPSEPEMVSGEEDSEMEPGEEGDFEDSQPSLDSSADSHDGIEDSIIDIEVGEEGDLPDLDDIPGSESPPPSLGEETSSLDEETTASPSQDWKLKAGAVALILFLIAIFFARLIRSRRKKSDFDFSRTNIDIDEIEE